MKKINLILLLVLAFQTVSASDDRTEVIQKLEQYFKWDLLGATAQSADDFFIPEVNYQHVYEGKMSVYTPDLKFKGLGAGAHKTHILDVNIYNDYATATVLFRYNPDKPKESLYLKTLILHKIAKGWRISNVLWGRSTPEK